MRRRSTRLEITAKGREHLGEIKELHDAHAEHTFGILRDAERSSLLDMFDQLRDHVAGRLPRSGRHTERSLGRQG